MLPNEDWFWSVSRRYLFPNGFAFLTIFSFLDVPSVFAEERANVSSNQMIRSIAPGAGGEGCALLPISFSNKEAGAPSQNDFMLGKKWLLDLWMISLWIYMDDFSKYITEFKTLSAFKGIYKSLKYQQILKSLNNPMDISADECNNSTLSDNIRQYSSGELNSATVLDKWHQIAPEREQYWELCRTISNINNINIQYQIVVQNNIKYCPPASAASVPLNISA